MTTPPKMTAYNNKYYRDTDGIWRYTEDDLPVPGAEDMTLSNYYNLRVIAYADEPYVQIPKSLAHNEPELAWCLDYQQAKEELKDNSAHNTLPNVTTMVVSDEAAREIKARQPIEIPARIWDKRSAEEPLGMWAPELADPSTIEFKLAYATTKAMRAAAAERDATKRRNAAIRGALHNGATQPQIAAITGLSQAQISKIKGGDDGEYIVADLVEVQYEVRAAQEAWHAAVAARNSTIIAAAEAGKPVDWISRVVGISRSTIYKDIINQHNTT